MDRYYLGEICTIQYGFPFDSSKFSASEGIPLIRIRDVVRGYTETFTTEKCKDEYVVYEGDLLVGMDGDFNIAKWGKTPAYLNQRVCRLIPKEVVDKDYLYYFMPNELQKIADKTSFVTVKHLSAKELNKIEILLPPLAEQQKIAAELEKISGLIAKRKSQIEKLDLLVKAKFVEMFGDPFKNEKGFKIKKGEQFFKLSNGKPVLPDQRHENGIPAYGGNGISWYTDDILFAQDTLVVGRVGFQSGNVRFVKGPMWVTDNAMYISEYCASEYNLLFLCALMEHINFSKFQDAGDLKKVTQKPFMQMDYISPPLPLQAQFAHYVQKVEQTKSTMQKSLVGLETLYKAKMQEYFE